DGNEQSTDAKSRLIRRQEKALDLKHHALSQFKDWYVAKKKERQQKKDAHKNGPALQGRAITFVPTEPWPQPADGAQLVKDIIAAIGRFAVMQDHERIAIAFWILHSHAHSAADCSPILTHLSPTPGCGKTQALGVEKRLVPKPLASSNCSPSAIFRCVEAHRPTLLIDEGDSFFSLDEALRGILNSGHTRTTAYVLRSEGKGNEPRQFSTWPPKITAAIGKLPLTIMQRSIIIHMRKRKQSEPVERFLDRREYPELEELRRKAARWTADNLTALEQAPEPSFPSNMDDRAVGNWIPLFTIADAIGAEWPRKIREAAQQFKGRPGTTPQVVELLADIRDVFAEKRIDRIWSADLVAALKDLDGRPWREGNRGKGLTTNYLANQLGEFDIHPDTVRIGTRTKKGYMIDWFKDAFERYLADEKPR